MLVVESCVWVAVNKNTGLILDGSERRVSHVPPAPWMLPKGFEWRKAKKKVKYAIYAPSA